MKKYLYILATAMTLVMAGCRSNNDPSIALDWRVDNKAVNITSSMNIIAAVNHDVQSDDRLAAFCEGACIGCCQPVDTDFGARFYLCIFQPLNPSKPISLSYYSAKDERIYSWNEAVSYTDDAVLGLASDPYWLMVNK